MVNLIEYCYFPRPVPDSSRVNSWLAWKLVNDSPLVSYDPTKLELETEGALAPNKQIGKEHLERTSDKSAWVRKTLASMGYHM